MRHSDPRPSEDAAFLIEVAKRRGRAISPTMVAGYCASLQPISCEEAEDA